MLSGEAKGERRKAKGGRQAASAFKSLSSGRFAASPRTTRSLSHGRRPPPVSRHPLGTQRAESLSRLVHTLRAIQFRHANQINTHPDYCFRARPPLGYVCEHGQQ
jgi:hypothetical protein